MAPLQNEQFILSRFQGGVRPLCFKQVFQITAHSNKCLWLYRLLQKDGRMELGSTTKADADEEILRQRFNIPKLAIIDQFFPFCCLMQGFLEQGLTVHFSISQPTVSRLCGTWIN